jgi:hypothetical protein
MSIWALSPIAALRRPDIVRLFAAARRQDRIRSPRGAALARVGVGGLLFRTIHLFFIKDVQSGLVWFTKIISDPFHDIMLYHKAPLYLLRAR